MEALFITTNTGSFELHHVPFENWLGCLKQSVLSCASGLVAVHVQETHEEAVQKLVDEIRHDWITGRNGESETHVKTKSIFTFLNPGEKSEEFTALGAVYLFDMDNVALEIWNYKENRFLPIPSNSAPSDPPSLNHSSVTSYTNYADKWLQNYVDWRQFPVHLFPSGNPSRKGFLRTRWRLNGVVLEMVNIHLFNDSCNLQSLKEHPSVYARFRAAGLKWTLDILEAEQCEDQNLVIFGDFNFRLNLPLYVQRLQATRTLPRSPSALTAEASTTWNDEVNTGKPNASDIVIERKVFQVLSPDRLTWSNFQPFLSLDEEAAAFSDQLAELPITFPPSYPFCDKPSAARDYDTTRCPGWCDRILWSQRTIGRLRPIAQGPIVYDLLGKDVALGDHKPVFVHCLL